VRRLARHRIGLVVGLSVDSATQPRAVPGVATGRTLPDAALGFGCVRRKRDTGLPYRGPKSCLNRRSQPGARRIGTPRGSHALGTFRQDVFVLRWFREQVCVHCLAREVGIS